MRKSINPVLNADLVRLARRGHGDDLVVRDTDFPVDTIARQTVLGRPAHRASGGYIHPEHLVEHLRPFTQAPEDQVFAASTERLPPLTSGVLPSATSGALDTLSPFSPQ